MNIVRLLNKSSPKILALGAHCDDIEIGCGATLLKLIDEYPNAEILWVVFSSNEKREAEAQKSAQIYLENHCNSRIEIKNFRNGFFPYVAKDIKEYFETLKTSFEPDIIFTHFLKDRHQDHRTIAELTWNTFRNHMILQYEILKYEGDLKTPNLYSVINEDYVERKINLLLSCFKSESDKHWFTKESFSALMRIRGVESGGVTGYAEGFHADKFIF
jgi:LmbE family N-acetylglucosaminyl deacetylase